MVNVPPSVLVAVLTYRRPADLVDLLAVLSSELPTEAAVLIIDNDPAASARESVQAHPIGATHTVRYVHEPRPGIAAARNRALAEAFAADEDLLVFLDDDERPGPGWLEHLLSVHADGGADGVVGPVVSSFPGELDPWIVEGRFFDRRRLPTGTVVEVAATNNLLLDLRRVRPSGITFDERFGLSGGSDTLFTRALSAAGLRLVWCDEAVVTDVVPPARATRGWVLRRALRSGNGWSRTALALDPGADPAARWRTRAGLTARGGVRVGAGLASVGAGVLTRRRSWRARGARTLMRGAGMVSGAWGWTYSEYRRRA